MLSKRSSERGHPKSNFSYSTPYVDIEIAILVVQTKERELQKEDQ